MIPKFHQEAGIPRRENPQDTWVKGFGKARSSVYKMHRKYTQVLGITFSMTVLSPDSKKNNPAMENTASVIFFQVSCKAKETA